MLVLEAMKMQNSLTAGKMGKVRLAVYRVAHILWLLQFPPIYAVFVSVLFAVFRSTQHRHMYTEDDEC